MIRNQFIWLQLSEHVLLIAMSLIVVKGNQLWKRNGTVANTINTNMLYHQPGANIIVWFCHSDLCTRLGRQVLIIYCDVIKLFPCLFIVLLTDCNLIRKIGPYLLSLAASCKFIYGPLIYDIITHVLCCMLIFSWNRLVILWISNYLFQRRILLLQPRQQSCQTQRYVSIFHLVDDSMAEEILLCCMLTNWGHSSYLPIPASTLAQRRTSITFSMIQTRKYQLSIHCLVCIIVTHWC